MSCFGEPTLLISTNPLCLFRRTPSQPPQPRSRTNATLANLTSPRPLARALHRCARRTRPSARLRLAYCSRGLVLPARNPNGSTALAALRLSPSWDFAPVVGSRASALSLGEEPPLLASLACGARAPGIWLMCHDHAHCLSKTTPAASWQILSNFITTLPTGRRGGFARRWLLRKKCSFGAR